MRVVLASSSPRRLQLFRQVGIEPRVIAPDTDESVNGNEEIDRFLERVTFQKLFSVYKKCHFKDLLVGADTIVVKDGSIYGKPRDSRDAARMLATLSGTDHIVKTAVAFIYQGESEYFIEESRVFFREISRGELDRYLMREDYLDKAGAYAIQGLASSFIKRVEGCFFNVMGFPLSRFFEALSRRGLELWRLDGALEKNDD